MPHTIVEYSASVADAFDRPAFGKDLHEALVRIAGGRAGGCKTRFIRLDDTWIADGSPHYAMVHAEIGLLSGRTTEVKRELNEAVLALLRQHTAPLPHLEVQFSVNLRDLERETYTRHDEPRTEA
jgi:5-carboxymethyl-2-hydroxymuconate isomerase